MSKLVQGVGINDADYVVARKETIGCTEGEQDRLWVCPFYRVWKDMINRSCGKGYKMKCPTYTEVTCCEDWLLFSNFKRWMEQQDWEGKQLDKDIVIPDSRLYSPETCTFILGSTNKFVLTRKASRGRYPLGVYYDERRRKYRAECSNPFTKRRESLGCFTNPEEAHEAWRKRKHELAQLVAETEADERVREALKKRYSKEEWYNDTFSY